MSNWGIGLLFSPGPGGRPEVLYLRDVESHCSACGLERVERFYSATSFHALTLRRLEALLESAPDAVSAPCAQCDAPMDGHDAVRWLLHYGFAGGDGLLQGFGTREGGRRWLLSPHARIDVQLVPEWDAAHDASNREVDTLDDETLLALFGRVLNPKESVRRAVAAAPVFSARVPHRIERLSEGLAVVLAPHGALDEAWVRRDLAGLDAVADTDDPADKAGGIWQIEPLAIAGETAHGFPAAPDEWLADVAARHPRLDVFGAARHGAATAGLRAAIDTFTVAVTLEPRDDAADVLELRAPGDPDMPPIAFPLADICREAARTMAAPADIARLEIDRALAGLTGLLGTDDDDA